MQLNFPNNESFLKYLIPPISDISKIQKLPFTDTCCVFHGNLYSRFPIYYISMKYNGKVVIISNIPYLVSIEESRETSELCVILLTPL